MDRQNSREGREQLTTGSRDPVVQRFQIGSFMDGSKSICQGRPQLMLSIAVVLTSFVVSISTAAIYVAARPAAASAPATVPVQQHPLPAPLAGVNLGGWLCLEDWFFSGDSGRFVSTTQPDGQGSCLPPLVRQLTEKWPSEGVLTQRLNQSRGMQDTIAAFEAHRHSFVGEEDLQAIASLGIQTIRVPLTWAAFADALAPIDKAIYGSHDPDKDTFIVPDPFYSTLAAFATVPRSWLAVFLHRADSHGLQVLFDLHAFPGGSADGTYNGVWPSPPAFWNHSSNIGNRSILLTDAGLWVCQGMVQWLESLDKTALRAVAGVTVMNEPAHMAAIDANAGKPFADEAVVLKWLSAASDIFRQSKLPSMGKKLYMQLIGTAFKDFDHTAVPWFLSTFTDAERNQWAVADYHFYTAWSGRSCDGRTATGGGFYCDQPLDEIRTLLRGCVKPVAQDMYQKFGNGLKAMTEFSIGTFSDAVLACNDQKVLRVFLEEQLNAFNSVGIEPFFWTWRMPFGPTFENGWSLRYISGLEKTRNPHPCLQPVQPAPAPPAVVV